jgi:hypothetical protein
VFGEVVGGDEGIEVGFQVVEGLLVEGPHGGVLDGTVHSLGLAVGPGVIGFGELVGDGVLAADAIEDVQAVLRGRTRAFVGTVGKRGAVVGQDGMELVAEGGDNAAQERGAGQHRGARVQLDVGKLRDAIDGEEHVHLALGAAQFADIDVDVSDRCLSEAPALGGGLLAPWQ